MQQLNELIATANGFDRVIKGMLDGSMTRDNGLFATAVTAYKLTNEIVKFAAYALPIIHTIHQAMLAAQAQAAQAAQDGHPPAPPDAGDPAPTQAQAQQAQAQQAQQQAQAGAGANVVPSNASDLQVVAGTPLVRP